MWGYTLVSGSCEYGTEPSGPMKAGNWLAEWLPGSRLKDFVLYVKYSSRSVFSINLISNRPIAFHSLFSQRCSVRKHTFMGSMHTYFKTWTFYVMNSNGTHICSRSKWDFNPRQCKQRQKALRFDYSSHSFGPIVPLRISRQSEVNVANMAGVASRQNHFLRRRWVVLTELP